MNYAIILCGGSGTRFWPLSRRLLPKQLLGICSGRPMIQETVRRISGLVKKENIYIAASRVHRYQIKDCLKKLDIPEGNFFFEPEGKNTLAPIVFLSYKILNKDPQAVIIVLPSDHFIKNKKVFLDSCRDAIDVARDGYIVAFGVPPVRPETGYGYIKIKAKRKTQNAKEKRGKAKRFFVIEKFVEKPDLRRAKRFIRDARYYWNSGTFVFTPGVMLEEVKRFHPLVYRMIVNMRSLKDINKLWGKLPFLSIDYGVMEKTRYAAVLPICCGWTDLGSWSALDEVVRKDKHGNILKGNCVDMGSKGSLVWAQDKLVATLRLKNIIVVDTKDALLVCPKENAQDIKNLVGVLRKRGFKNKI